MDRDFGQNETDEIRDWTGIQDIDAIPPKLLRSPHFLEYVDCIKAGWTVREVQKYAVEKFGEEISTGTFGTLAKMISEAKKLPRTYKESVLNGIDTKLNLLQEWEDLITVGKLRLTRLLDLETKMAGLPLPQVNYAIENLGKLLEKYGNHRIAVGIVLGNGNGRKLVGFQNDQDRARLAAEGLSEDQRKKLLATIYEIEGIVITDLETVGDDVSVTEEVALSLE